MATKLTLAGVRAVVTGSTRGLGAAVARELVERGASVVVNGTSRELGAQLAEELGARFVHGSVADGRIVEELVDTCCDAYGGIDFVVNNAGVTRDGRIAKLTADEFDEVIAVHLRGTWLMCRSAARAMRGHGGSIVNIVSGTALYGNVGQSNYAAAKGGVPGLTRALSLELARSGIRVNAVSPIAHTEMIDPLFAFADGRADLRPFFGEPADVATAIVYFATPEAADLTGQVVGFDGRALTVWSHPAALRARRQDERWSLQDVHGALRAGQRSTLRPDALGAAVQRLMS